MARKAGETAMMHARAWARSEYPDCLMYEAHAKIVWIPDGRGGRRPISKGEDIWGVFDLAVFPVEPIQRGFPSKVELIQVTTLGGGKIDGGNVAKRKHKVGAWIDESFHDGYWPDWLHRISVIAWIPRKHFRWWVWGRDGRGGGRWVESEPVPAPLPRTPRIVQNPSSPETTTPESLFD